MSKGLGRGLGAILGDIEESYIKDISTSTDVIKEIEIDKIVPNPYQPRKIFDDKQLQELAQSIKNQGLLQPILVTKDDDGYILIAGERRLRAHKLLNKSTIKSLIIDFDLTKLREYAILENIQREDLNVLDLSQSLYELIEEHSYTHEEVASLLSKSRSYITNLLRLLKLSDYTKDKLQKNLISFAHAKVLVNIDEVNQKKLVDTIIGQKLSAKETENLVRKYKSEIKPVQNSLILEESKDKLDDEIKEIISLIKSKNGLNIRKSNNSIVINVTSKKDLKKIKKIFDI